MRRGSHVDLAGAHRRRPRSRGMPVSGGPPHLAAHGLFKRSPPPARSVQNYRGGDGITASAGQPATRNTHQALMATLGGPFQMSQTPQPKPGTSRWAGSAACGRGREVTGLRVAMVTTTSMESSRFRSRKKGPDVMAIFALANRHRRLNAPAQPTLIDVAPWHWEQQQPGIVARRRLPPRDRTGPIAGLIGQLPPPGRARLSTLTTRTSGRCLPNRRQIRGQTTPDSAVKVR